MEVEQFFAERRYSQITEEFPDRNLFPLYYEANKQEIILNAGECLYIPAGWFHFVFSENVEESTGLNLAVNFWYEVHNDFVEGQSNDDTPEKFNHTIPNLNLAELIPDDYTLMVYDSKKPIVGPLSIKSRCKNELSWENKTWKDFITERKPHSYIVQWPEFNWIEEYVVDKKRRLKNHSAWINFGNVHTYLHYDLNDNHLCQIKGRKRILLFPPSERNKLYMFNQYPIEIIDKLRSAWFDNVHIRRYRNTISPDTTEIDQDLMLSKYHSTLNEYIQDVGCSVGINTNKPKFIIINTSDENKDIKLFDQFAYVIWFLNHGYIQIRDGCHEMFAGCSVIFPNSYPYTWNVHGGSKIIIAVEDPQPI